MRAITRPALLAVAALSVVLLTAAPADAHPFLVRTDPAQGARLTAAPRIVSLQFSEPLGDAPPELSISRQGGGVAEDLPVSSIEGGRVLRADVAVGPGVFTVAWRVVADDGHLSEGSFSFAVGSVSELPAPATAAPAPPHPLRAVAAWVFFLGLAVALGAAATAVLVDRDRTARGGAIRAGLLLALIGAGVTWAASVGGIAGPASTVRQEVLLASTVALVSLAMLLRRDAFAAGVLTAGGAVVWSARGQVAVRDGAVGLALDGVHLLAAAVWVGALLVLVRDLWQLRGNATQVLRHARRYSALVVAPVVALAAAGAGSALLMLPEPEALWSSGYGRLVLAKTAAFVAALAVAWRARRRIESAGAVALRGLTRVEGVLVVAVLAVAAVLVNTAPPAPPLAPVSLLGPPPMAGPVARDAGLAGILTVAVAVGDGRLQVEVLVPGGAPTGTRGDIEVDTGSGPARVELQGCGAGCYAGPWVPPRGRITVRVEASSPGWRGGSFTARLVWPPARQSPESLEAVLDTMRAEPAVAMTEQTSSGPDSVVTPVTISGTGAELVDEAPYASGGADDVRALPSGDGIRLYLAGERMWVTMWLDSAGRIARERIVNVGHRIDRTYRYPGG